LSVHNEEETMKFTQYYLDCLSQASYLIGDETTGRAVVVDPRRDIDEYVADATAAGLTIEMVIETHFHADFLSGHLELAAATGAEIAYSSVAETEFPSRKLADGEQISLGDVRLEIRHTPGHTPESISIVVWEHADDEVPYGVLTGDALFIGDVGRPDLLASLGYTRDELAHQLYDSLHTQLLTLPDATRVYPAHGAGSACGKNLSTETWSTIGDQRVENYALLAPDRETFVDLVTEGQPPAPSYFVYDAVLNRQDRPLLDETDPLRRSTSPRSTTSSPPAPCSSTAAPPRSSATVTCAARSTSVSRAATRSSPARSCPMTSTSSSSSSPASNSRPATDSAGSASTASSATSSIRWP
jgi:hydroxyacylglutathione hydrolase